MRRRSDFVPPEEQQRPGQPPEQRTRLSPASERLPAVNMPINFTVVPVEDADGGGSGTAAAGGTKADRSVPTVVVDDGDTPQAQDSGRYLTGGAPAAALLLFGITRGITNNCAHRHTQRLQ